MTAKKAIKMIKNILEINEYRLKVVQDYLDKQKKRERKDPKDLKITGLQIRAYSIGLRNSLKESIDFYKEILKVLEPKKKPKKKTKN